MKTSNLTVLMDRIIHSLLILELKGSKVMYSMNEMETDCVQ